MERMCSATQRLVSKGGGCSCSSVLLCIQVSLHFTVCSLELRTVTSWEGTIWVFHQTAQNRIDSAKCIEGRLCHQMLMLPDSLNKRQHLSRLTGNIIHAMAIRYPSTYRHISSSYSPQTLAFRQSSHLSWTTPRHPSGRKSVSQFGGAKQNKIEIERFSKTGSQKKHQASGPGSFFSSPSPLNLKHWRSLQHS